MSERDPRRRRKKRESLKRDDKSQEDVAAPASEKLIFTTDWRKDSIRESDPDQDDIKKIRHEPSQTAKIVFFILFTLLAVAVGAVFISLHGADRGPIEILEEHEEPHDLGELIHGELDEHESKELDHGEHADEHEEEEHIEGHDEHEHEEDSEPGFFSSFMDIFGSSAPDLAVEEILPVAKVDEESETKEHVVDAKVTEFKEAVDTIHELESQNEQADNDQDEEEQAEPADDAASSEVNKEEDEDEDEPEDEVEGEEDEDVGTTEGNEELDPSAAWFTEHVPVSTKIPDLEEEDDSETPSEEIEAYVKFHDGEDTTKDSDNQYDDLDPTESYYEKDDITNEYDYLIKEDLDDAEKILVKSPEEALRVFEGILQRYPQTPRGLYGKALALDKMAEVQRNNSLLEQSILAYEHMLMAPEIPDKLYRLAGERAVDRMRFRGLLGRGIRLQKKLTERFSDDVNIKNQLAVSYLLVGQGQEAKKVLKEVLEKDAGNGYAMVHYGFILKTEDNNYEEAIKYLSEGIATQHEGVIDGRFFFHLGDALARIGKPDKAMEIYKEGAKMGVFRSPYQRSLYNVNGLTAKPWWKPEETPYYNYVLLLEKNWEKIRDEGRALLNDKKTGFVPEAEGLKDTGEWKQFELFARGKKITRNCQRAPFTCLLVENIPDAATCKRGQVKFSVMQPGTHVWAHTGPTNCRLRAHLGLVVPPGVTIRVANETRGWDEGKVFIFDDSFEHEVWHRGNSYRLVFLVDFWHPELTPQQRAALTPI